MAQVGSVFVDARSNIFGYGISTPQPGGGGGGILATRIVLTPGTNRQFTFSASGLAGWSGTLTTGPDGGIGSSPITSIPAVGPISSFNSPLRGQLVGLFVETGDISGLTAPTGISYPNDSSLQQASYSPGLRQIFYIGDGRTGTGIGSTQIFNAPNSASILVLGIADAFNFQGDAGWYDDNVGGYTVNFIPSPSAAALLGLGGLLAARRRR